MRRALENIPLVVVFLPVFFVLHGYRENFGYIDPGACALLALGYIGAALLCFGILFLFYRNALRAGLMTTAVFAVYFFFGSVHDLLYDHRIFLHQYLILLPLLLILLAGLFVWLRRTKRSFRRVMLFVNILLILWLLTDGVQTAWLAMHPAANRLSVYGPPTGNTYRPCSHCANPDIYLLLFDEYAGTDALKEAYGYDNSGIGAWLTAQGFHIVRGSRGNYNYTPFCMASMLNMSYLQGFRTGEGIDVRDFAACNSLIRNNEVQRFLSARGYDVVNYSIFDLAGNPSPFNQMLLPLKTNLITGRTLFYVMYRDLGWHLHMLPRPISSWFGELTWKSFHDNNEILRRTEEESGKMNGAPRFVYAHFEMPHSPFYIDAQGHTKPDTQINRETFQTGDPGPYLGYLPYTNSRIRELVTTIRERTHDSAVIIVMGDHGYRENLPDSQNARHFQILNAVYFPDKDYHLFTDSLSEVNQFRVIFNKLFDQNMALLRDSTLTLRDKR